MNFAPRADIHTHLEQGSDISSMLIGLSIAPVYDSDVRASQYPKISIANRGNNRLEPSKRAPGTSYPEVSSTWGWDNYATEDHGYKEKIDDSIKKDNSRFFDVEVSVSAKLDDKLALDHERRVACQLYNPASFIPAAAVEVYTEANIAKVDFVRDIQNAHERALAVGCLPNTLVISSALLKLVKRTPKFQSYVRGSFPSISPVAVSNKDLIEILSEFGVKDLKVGATYVNVAGEGLPYSAAPVWSNGYFWVGKLAGGDFSAGGAMRTIAWTEDGGVKTVESAYDSDIRSTWYRVRQNVTEKVIDETAGQLVTTAWA